MPSLRIDRDNLQKLTHESIEIRLRTLEQISSKLNRALALNENIEFKAGELCKQLIRWFGFSPLHQSVQVLKLLELIFESPAHGPKAVKRLGAVRLAKEFRKIQAICNGHTEELKIIDKIKNILQNYNEETKEESETPRDKQRSVDELIRGTSDMNLDERLNTDEYEVAWSRPSASDYTSMKFLSDILINPLASTEEREDVLLHLQLTMCDYPAEYMLQAPHIFRNLLYLYDNRKSDEAILISTEYVGETLKEFLFNLNKRLRRLRKTITFRSPKSVKSNSSANTQTPCQLKYEIALANLLEVSIYHLEMNMSHGIVDHVVWDIIFSVIKIMEIMDRSIDITNIAILQKLSSMVVKLNSKLFETEHCARLRLYQMQMIFLLQDLANVFTSRGETLKSTKIFEPILRDYSLKCLFNSRYKLLETIVIQSDKSLNEKYELLESYEKSFEISLKMLKKKNELSCYDVIEQADSICKVLDKLQSKRLIDILFEAIIKAIPKYRSNAHLKGQSINIIQKLLSLTFMPLKRHLYDKICSAFKCHIGCLMTGERYVIECTNSELLEVQIVGIPLSVDLLLEFVYDGFENVCNKIQSNSFKILELLLQSHSLFGANWYSLLPLLTPVLPLLTCCTSSKKITDLLLKLYNPDLKLLPYISVLRGNLVFLFNVESEIRSEALMRLLYSINSLKDAEKYIPNLMEISDTLPNDICLLNSPVEYNKIFTDRTPVREDTIISLNNLLQLLDSSDVEPLIRKTTLMQINVLCSIWHITGELCKSGAFYLILQALENALLQSSVIDYPDSAVPAISILNKVMLYDSSVRCELSETPNIYVLIIRALLMYNHDIQIRTDATMCLFQLLFATHLISTDTTVEGPLILGKLQIPLNLKLRSAISNKKQQEPEKLSSLFSTASEEIQYWRMVIGATCFNGLTNITQKSILLLSEYDFREELKLTSQDVRLIRATQPSVSLCRLIKASLNATDHTSLTQACVMLKQQLLVAKLNNTFCVDENFCVELNILLQKYLQLPPGNKSDLQIFEHLLDILQICLKIPLNLVLLELFKFIQKDTRHPLITLITQNEELPFRIYYKITVILRLLINRFSHSSEENSNAIENSQVYSNLFDLFMERCLQLFEIRDLQRVRCLLSLVACLSSCQINMSDEALFFYCRRLAQLSLALKSFTQTGAQWHRDCSLGILQLRNQMQNCCLNFRLSSGFLRYFSGLCGHNDDEVRVLAWSILTITAETKSIEATQTVEQKSTDISGVELLVNELSYLPGGFMACCLSTLLDCEEIIGVRHLAGQLSAILIRKQHEQVERIEKVFERHNFLPSITVSFTSSLCILDGQLPKDLEMSNISVITHDLLSCYALICFEYSLRQPLFLNELCTLPFMFKLYEIFKAPPPYNKNEGYLNMIGHICRLYSLCYSNNFIFLQRTICRDIAWITNFCHILFKIVLPSKDENITVDMLQLFMVLCKDTTALCQLSAKLIDYCVDIMKFLKDTLVIKNLNTRLQSCLLSLISLLLIKTQQQEDRESSILILEVFDSPQLSLKTIGHNEHFKSDNKENRECISLMKEQNDKDKSSVSDHLTLALIRLFTHLYPIKVCKFSAAPSTHQQHITQTLALLLKQSSICQETALGLKLQDKVLKIFKNFFDEFSTTSCTTFVKRNGENKKIAVIKNIQLLLKLLLSWYSSPLAMITDNSLAMDYSRILIQTWPWVAYSSDLKLTVLETSAAMSERSLVVCKQFSTFNNSSFPHSVLQLIVKLITAETLRIKATSVDCKPVIFAGLRTLTNCCSCIEGRTALNKAHVMDIFDNIHPFNMKAPQLKRELLILWLKFWELFSRYDEGAQLHHLNVLCSVINKSKPQFTTRLVCLRILRNMVFQNSNRSGLITSTDFLYTINEIVLQPIKNSVEEQFIVCVAIWKLMSGGTKYVALIRNTKLTKHLRVLKDTLSSKQEENVETTEYASNLLNILNIIFKLLSY